jgi:hypothetical protein
MRPAPRLPPAASSAAANGQYLLDGVESALLSSLPRPSTDSLGTLQRALEGTTMPSPEPDTVPHHGLLIESFRKFSRVLQDAVCLVLWVVGFI